ncbi:MAG: hypothetical protein HQL51_15350 [Magnetococcales bacterium]|nr:hypothetical protein [Magnetococcales bacterium]
MNRRFHAHPQFRNAVEALPSTPFSLDVPGDGRGRARAHNFLYDERVGDERAERYLAHLALPEGTTPQHLRKRHAAYVEERVQTVGVPDAFLPGGRPAQYDQVAGSDLLVRVENIGELLAWLKTKEGADTEDRAFDRLSALLEDWTREPPGSPRHNDARALLEEAMEYWNTWRDNRPSFVALAQELDQEIAADDWAAALRTRLGLAHYNPQPPAVVHVALMRYPASDVLKAAQSMGRAIASPFASPTVLDQEMWEYFFPAPTDPRSPTSYGRAMALEPVRDTGRLLAEMLHVKINYQPNHLFKLGRLTGPIPPHPLPALRNAHLDALRIETEREDFGEMIPETVP